MFEPLESQLRERREQLNLSQGEAARLAGVGRAQYAALEAGKANITLGFLLKITAVLGIKAVMVKDLGIYSASPDVAALVRAQDAINRTRALLAKFAGASAELDEIVASIADVITAPPVNASEVLATGRRLASTPAGERAQVAAAIRDVAQTDRVERQKRPTRTKETANTKRTRTAR